jgi:hypothetical protein
LPATNRISQVTAAEVGRVLDGVNECIAKQHALAIYWVLTVLTAVLSGSSFIYQVVRYIKIYQDMTTDVKNWSAFWEEGVEFGLNDSAKWKIPHFWFFFGLLNLLFCVVFYFLGRRAVNTVVSRRICPQNAFHHATFCDLHTYSYYYSCAKRSRLFFTASLQNL